jgi:cytidyltransferase-like protein
MQLIPNAATLPEGTVRIGLLPGSFNPPHAGHLDLAIRARETGIDHVLFYANSFNLAKRRELAAIEQRREMVEGLIDHACMSILPAAFYPDAPADALIGHEYSFAPLVRLLETHLPDGCELWMLRGGDYFTRSGGRAAAYPHELRHLPHVVGTRGLDPDDLDLLVLRRSICVETLAISSTELRRQTSDRRTVE